MIRLFNAWRVCLKFYRVCKLHRDFVKMQIWIQVWGGAWVSVFVKFSWVMLLQVQNLATLWVARLQSVWCISCCCCQDSEWGHPEQLHIAPHKFWWDSMCGPQTSRVGINWELCGNSHLGALPQSTKSEALSMGPGNCKLCRWLITLFKGWELYGQHGLGAKIFFSKHFCRPQKLC